MSLGEGLRLRSIPQRFTRLALFDRDWVLVVLGVCYTLAYCSLFIVMHLKSQSWAPGQVLDEWTRYWSWFYSTIFSEARVMAPGRSALAAPHRFWMLASMVVISVIYLLLLRLLRSLVVPQQPRLRALMTLAILASLPLLMLPNLLSSDIYSYVAYGRIAAVHGGNPFIDTPSRFRFDPFYQYVYWKQVASVYGPGWIYPSIILTLVVDSIKSDIVTYVLAYKIFMLGLHLLNGWLIWLILERWRPEQRAFGTALYLLNPLTLIEFPGNAHNDALMITFTLLGVYLHVRGHWYWTIAAFTLAVLTKWLALPLLGLYGLALLWQTPTWRERVWRGFASLIIFASLCVSLYRPYWEGWRTLKILTDGPPQEKMINSLGDMASNEIQRAMWLAGRWPNPALADPMLLFSGRNPFTTYNSRNNDQPTSNFWTQQNTQYQRDRAEYRVQQRLAIKNRDWTNDLMRKVGLAVLALACLVAVAVTRKFEHALLAGTWVFFVYSTVSAVWFWPWYGTWFVAMAAILDWRVTGRTAVLLALLLPLTYIFYPSLPDPVWWQRYRSVLIFVPPMLYAGYHGVLLTRQAWRKRQTKRMVAAHG